ncbi:hypothetical protein SAMN05421890_4913 [Ensifer adhaerens]|nr:hypothetical protein SAMN05421890_4913 [Ensifer adhaerens]
MNTIADIRKNELWLGVRCTVCGRSVRIPHKILPVRLAADLPVRLAAAFFRCQGCGSKELESFAEGLTANVPFSDGWKRQA